MITLFVFLPLVPFRSKFLALPREQRPFNGVGKIKVFPFNLSTFSRHFNEQHYNYYIPTLIHSFIYSFSEHLLSANFVSGNPK